MVTTTTERNFVLIAPRDTDWTFAFASGDMPWQTVMLRHYSFLRPDWSSGGKPDFSMRCQQLILQASTIRPFPSRPFSLSKSEARLARFGTNEYVGSKRIGNLL